MRMLMILIMLTMMRMITLAHVPKKLYREDCWAGIPVLHCMHVGARDFGAAAVADAHLRDGGLRVARVSKETEGRSKRGLMQGKRELLQKASLRDAQVSKKRPIIRQKRPIKSQKRPTNVLAYLRDAQVSKKRPMHMAKEACLFTWRKRPRARRIPARRT
jgi:hypothetical protein